MRIPLFAVLRFLRDDSRCTRFFFPEDGGSLIAAYARLRDVYPYGLPGWMDLSGVAIITAISNRVYRERWPVTSHRLAATRERIAKSIYRMSSHLAHFQRNDLISLRSGCL